MGLGLLSGRAAPPFLFSWGGAPARVIGRRAGVWRVWLVACGLRPLGAPGRVIGRGMVHAYLAGRGPTKTRCGWLCVPGWSHPRVWG